MTVEELYLENIDEYVKDENNIVTYKWLSLTLQVHCNTAKQMLFKYLDTERNLKNNDGLTVTYFVSGLTKPDDNGDQMFKCMVVPENKLETSKSSLAVLTSCHIYSIQRTQLKDSNALFMTDFAKFKENVFDSNKYSSIRCERAKLRSQDELDLLTVNYTAPAESEKKSAVSNGGTGTKLGDKKQPSSAIANMFAKADNKKSATDSKTDKKPAVKEETKTETKQTTGKTAIKKDDVLKSMFSKQADKKVSAPKDTDKKTNKETSKTVEKKKSPEKSEIKSRKKARQEESDEEEQIVRSKRRRTGQDLFDSDSEGEEEMEAESESPIPPTPPREVTPEPEPKPDSPEVEEIEDPVPKKSSKGESSKGGNTGERRRVKKRKLVDKTYMDKEGFMVTEKVYQEESTDASESEEPVKKEVKKTAPSKSPPKGKKSPKKPSPGKKGQTSGKQTSLMSFFKKS